MIVSNTEFPLFLRSVLFHRAHMLHFLCLFITCLILRLIPHFEINQLHCEECGSEHLFSTDSFFDSLSYAPNGIFTGSYCNSVFTLKIASIVIYNNLIYGPVSFSCLLDSTEERVSIEWFPRSNCSWLYLGRRLPWFHADLEGLTHCWWHHP